MMKLLISRDPANKTRLFITTRQPDRPERSLLLATMELEDENFLNQVGVYETPVQIRVGKDDDDER